MQQNLFELDLKTYRAEAALLLQHALVSPFPLVRSKAP